jgi:hypothetical protein
LYGKTVKFTDISKDPDIQSEVPDKRRVCPDKKVKLPDI